MKRKILLSILISLAAVQLAFSQIDSCVACPPGTILGPNLIDNGDFSQGYNDFSSEYTVDYTGNLFPGKYGIRNSMNMANGNWTCLDHTDNDPLGNFLAVDGSAMVNNTLACYLSPSPINVQVGSLYIFCVYVNNMVEPLVPNHQDPTIQITINGLVVATMVLPKTPDEWVLMTAAWTADVPTAEIRIRTLNFAGTGNDFALDDISFAQCSPNWPCAACPPGSTQGPNLIMNSDFSAGNALFTSGYTFVPVGSALNNGKYGVRNSTNLLNGNWTCTDHTTGGANENFLAVDGAQNINLNCWQSTVNVQPGRQYAFCAYVDNMNEPAVSWATPDIEVRVNGTAITSINLAQLPDEWVLLTALWTANTTTATISIRTLSIEDLGNDFAIDDISFSECVSSLSCPCGPYEMTLQQGANTWGLQCDAPAFALNCPVNDIAITGSFACAGSPLACPASPVWWSLSDPVGNIYTGSAPANAIALNFPSTLVSMPGPYQLFLRSACPGLLDSCTCLVNWVQPECPSDCSCGSFGNLGIGSPGGSKKKLFCNNDQLPPLPCPTASSPYTVWGKLDCAGGCPGSNISWSMTGPSGGVVLTGSAPGPWFSFQITNSTTTEDGLYTVSLQGICNGDTCHCIIYLPFTGCETGCSCLPATAFQSEVNQGFQIQSEGGCFKSLFPNGEFTDCDQVTWRYRAQGAIAFTAMGATQGADPLYFSFPGENYYEVCMKVTRTQADGTTCTFEVCQMVAITCFGIPQLQCEEPVMDNSGFTQDAATGIIGLGGASAGWSARAGTPEIVTGQDCADPVAVKIRGNAAFADIIDHALLIKLGQSYRYRFCFNQSEAHANSPFTPGGEIVGRLSKQPQHTAICQGDCEEIFRIKTPENTKGWMEAQGSFKTASLAETVFLTLHIENPINEPESGAQSIVLLDNICIENSAITSAVKAAVNDNGITVAPNPTTGTFTLKLGELPAGRYDMQILDLSGRLLYVERLQPGKKEHEFSIADLPGGFYLLKVSSNGAVVSVKKIVKN